MKLISRTSIGFLSILLFVNTVSSGTSIYGDVVITNENGSFNCDSMICPPETVRCHVNKRNDPNDFMKILRVRKCIGPNQEVVKEETVSERNVNHGNVNVNVVSGSGGNSRELTPEERRELEETLRRTQEEIQAQLSETLSNVANLRERILADVRNNLNKWY